MKGAPTIDPIPLLLDLVRTPSLSGDEDAAADLLARWYREHGLRCTKDETGVHVVVEGSTDGPTLLFASHLDTVPVGEGWTRDPFATKPIEGKLTARGAVDAKSSIAAMSTAAARVKHLGGPQAGRLIVLATYCEETRDTTMPAARARLPHPPDAAVIGEPTSLQPCTAQRGLMVVRITWRGRQLHAGWTEGGAADTNAIRVAAREIDGLRAHLFPREHPSLGRTSVTPTRIEAGVARNMTPPTCEMILDIRTTPAYTHEEIASTLRSHFSQASVEILSDRYQPAETPRDSKLLASLMRVASDSIVFASPTASDWVWLRDLDAIKFGPGDSRQSHRPDETIAIAEVERAAALLTSTAMEYLA